jgi:uncharacterized membrane protein
MNWLLVALLAPLLWAISAFIDKLLISKYFKGGLGTLIIYSCFIGLPVSVLILIFKPAVLSISLVSAILVTLNGFVYILYLFPYLKALNKSDTSLIIPMFQTIPIFVYFLAFFILSERLSGIQIFGSILIMFGAIGISFRYEKKKISIGKEVLLLMLLASFIVSLNSLFFKFFALELDFWTVSFWQYLGFFIFGVILLIFVKSYRKDFLSSFKGNTSKIISLNALNETINIIGSVIFTYATLLAPLSLVWVVNGFNPFFVFVIGFFLTIFFPGLIKENLSKRTILQKLFFIAIIFVGAYFLNVL